MSFKLGGSNISTFAGNQISFDPALPAANAQTDSPTVPKKFEAPPRVSVQTAKGEDPKQVHQRLLREAASRAGLDGTPQAEKFVEMYENYTLDYANPKQDRTPADGAAITAQDVVSETVPYILDKGQITALKNLQKEYLAADGKLHTGKNYQTAPNADAGKQHKTREDYERQKLNQLIRDAQIPTTFGTPTKLRDLKHITLELPDDQPVNNDRALRLYIQKNYGEGNLQGDNIESILNSAKRAGVKVENLKVGDAANSPRQAEFDVSAENLLKLHTLYIGEQAKVNHEVELFDNATRDTVANRFMQGVFEGAWESLKANGEILSDPIGAMNKLRETVAQLAAIDPVLLGKAIGELAANSPELVKQGATAVGETKVGDAAQAAGKLVGAAVAELITGKGAAVAFKGLAALSKTESGALLLAKVAGAATKATEAVLEIEVPVRAAEIVLTDGSKIKIPFGESQKLSDLISLMKDSSEKLGMLEDGTAVGRKAITETAEEGLTDVSQSGMKRVKGELSKEALKAAKEQLVTLNVARTELVARLEELTNKVPGLSQHAVADIGKAKNNLLNHLTQDDLVGALRDKFGKEVRRSGDGYVYQHSKEVSNGVGSLKNARDSIINQLQKHQKGSAEYNLLSKEADALAEMSRRIARFLDPQ